MKFPMYLIEVDSNFDLEMKVKDVDELVKYVVNLHVYKNWHCQVTAVYSKYIIILSMAARRNYILPASIATFKSIKTV